MLSSIKNIYSYRFYEKTSEFQLLEFSMPVLLIKVKPLTIRDIMLHWLFLEASAFKCRLLFLCWYDCLNFPRLKLLSQYKQYITYMYYWWLCVETIVKEGCVKWKLLSYYLSIYDLLCFLICFFNRKKYLLLSSVYLSVRPFHLSTVDENNFFTR